MKYHLSNRQNKQINRDHGYLWIAIPIADPDNLDPDAAAASLDVPPEWVQTVETQELPVRPMPTRKTPATLEEVLGQIESGLGGLTVWMPCYVILLAKWRCKETDGRVKWPAYCEDGGTRWPGA